MTQTSFFEFGIVFIFLYIDDFSFYTDNGDERDGTLTKVRYNVIFVTAEATPYSKTGGLGDVCGSLPIAFATRGHRVMVVSPRYLNGSQDDKYACASDLEKHINLSCFQGEQEVVYFHEYRAGVDWVITYLIFIVSKALCGI